MSDVKWGHPLSCPYCLANMNASITPPREGDYSVCLFCGGVLRFTANALSLEKVDIKDVPSRILAPIKHTRLCVASVYLDKPDIKEEEAERFLEAQAETLRKRVKPVEKK